MNKANAYRSLVRARKECCICRGLSNPSRHEGGRYDSNEIGPWSLWQNNLEAEIMVVGQDWGDTAFFTKWEGIDPPSNNPTNDNLRKLFSKSFGIDIKAPREPREHHVFLTNVILCLKSGGLQAPVLDEWFWKCSTKFFRPLVEIVNPRAVLTLGKRVAESVLATYEIPYKKSWRMIDLINKGPFRLFRSTYLFPLYHCGAGSINRNRPFSQQFEDWQRVVNWLCDE